MIIQVPVSRELIEQCFATGYELRRKVLRVIDGIPPGSKLLSVANSGDYEVHFVFMTADHNPDDFKVEVKPVVVHQELLDETAVRP